MWPETAVDINNIPKLVITLPAFTMRQRLVHLNFSRMGWQYELFHGFDKRQFTKRQLYDICMRYTRVSQLFTHTRLPVELAILYSHRMACEYVYQQGWPYAMICEDDIQFTAAIFEQRYELVPPEFRLLYLAGLAEKRGRQRVKDTLYRVRHVFGMMCYLVNRGTLTDVIESLSPEYDRRADWATQFVNKLGHSYMFIPCPASSLGLRSTRDARVPSYPIDRRHSVK